MKDDLIALRERVQTLVEGEPRHPDYMSMDPAELGQMCLGAGLLALVEARIARYEEELQ